MGADEHFVNISVGFEVGCNMVEIFHDVAIMNVVLGIKKGFKNLIAKVIDYVIDIVVVKVKSTACNVCSPAEFGNIDVVDVVFFFNKLGEGLADETTSFYR